MKPQSGDRPRLLSALPWLGATQRVLGALLGGYALCAAAVALLAAALPGIGLARSEAVVLSAMLGFPAYLLVLLWAFSVRSPVRLWTALAGGTAACCALLALIC